MGPHNPLFTVVVPTYRRPALLREAVDSVLTQTVDDLELLVVDDAGGDVGTLPHDDRCRLIRRTTGGGQGSAINTGVAAAQGRNLAFLDDDDWYEPERLEAVLPALLRSPIVICWSRHDDAVPHPGRSLHGDVAGTILDATTPHLGATTLRRESFLPFDEQFAASADIEWWLRIAQVNTVETMPEVCHVIRRHSGMRERNSREARIQSGVQLLELHRDWFDQHPRAAGFRYLRIGVMAASVGDHDLARRALLRAARLRPGLRVGRHLLLSLRPSRIEAGVRLP